MPAVAPPSRRVAPSGAVGAPSTAGRASFDRDVLVGHGAPGAWSPRPAPTGVGASSGPAPPAGSAASSGPAGRPAAERRPHPPDRQHGHRADRQDDADHRRRRGPYRQLARGQTEGAVGCVQDHVEAEQAGGPRLHLHVGDVGVGVQGPRRRPDRLPVGEEELVTAQHQGRDQGVRRIRHHGDGDAAAAGRQGDRLVALAGDLTDLRVDGVAGVGEHGRLLGRAQGLRLAAEHEVPQLLDERLLADGGGPEAVDPGALGPDGGHRGRRRPGRDEAAPRTAGGRGRGRGRTASRWSRPGPPDCRPATPAGRRRTSGSSLHDVGATAITARTLTSFGRS